MGTSSPIASFSVYAVRLINPLTGKPVGKPIEVLESSSLNLSGENINLMGGALRFPWEIESGDMTAELALAFSEYPSYLPKYLLGATVSDIAASAGEISDIEANVGSSMLSATAGISDILALAGSEANLKTTKYFLVAKTATTGSLYAASDIDFERGVTGEMLDDEGLIADDLDLSATLDLTAYGIQFEVTGITDFTIGDAIGFDVSAENEGGYKFDVGAANSKFPEFRAIVYAELSSTGQLFELDCYRCQATGMPMGFNRKAFSSSEVTIGLKYDAGRKKVYGGKQLKLKE